MTQTREVDAFSKIVPQDDIIHLALPLARTLRYAAALRGVPRSPDLGGFHGLPGARRFPADRGGHSKCVWSGTALWPPDKVDYTCGASPAAVLSLSSRRSCQHRYVPVAQRPVRARQAVGRRARTNIVGSYQ